MDRVDLAGRLLLAIVVVVLVGAGTAWTIGAAVGPRVFREHMLRAAETGQSPTEHAERAFATASVLALSVALVAALLASAVVSVLLARRIRRSLAPLGDAARRVAAGERGVRVAPPGVGPEFDRLAEAFTAMAADLGSAEDTRTRMLADLAHEMRTPLSVLLAYLEAIGEGVEVADGPTMQMMRGQVERLARLSEDVALVTSAEEGRLALDRRRVDLDDLVREAASQAAVRFDESGATLDVTSSPGVTVVADPDRIGQVLTNLLDNARRATPAGGAVSLRVYVAPDVVRVEVQDTGEGIAAEHLPRVFERFYRIDTARDRAHGGSGIGLAIAMAIARSHGGTLTAASPGPGLGATFALTLPLADGPSAP